MKSILAAFSFLMAAQLAGAVEPLEFMFESLKPGETVREGSIKTSSQKEAVIFDIHDARGLGGVSITPKLGVWPKSVIVRLHLSGLESLRMSNGKVTLSGSVVSQSGHMRLLEIEESDKKREADKNDPLWVNIRMLDGQGNEIDRLPVPEKGGYFEITLPPALLCAAKRGMTLRWIDFYRQ
ncbi:MAG: hypothetical protein K8R87_01045 [Verrucomicrobia bacterium]|nr:hypothetical protein [Verrucomicrobiota bacterium]